MLFEDVCWTSYKLFSRKTLENFLKRWKVKSFLFHRFVLKQHCRTNCNQSIPENDTGNGSVHCFEGVECKYFCLPWCLFTKIWHLYLLEQVCNVVDCSISMRVYLGNSFLSLPFFNEDEDTISLLHHSYPIKSSLV